MTWITRSTSGSTIATISSSAPQPDLHPVIMSDTNNQRKIPTKRHSTVTRPTSASAGDTEHLGGSLGSCRIDRLPSISAQA